MRNRYKSWEATHGGTTMKKLKKKWLLSWEKVLLEVLALQGEE